MVLNESELQQIYEFAKRAEFAQLVVLSQLFQQFVESAAKEEQEGLAFMLNKYEESKKNINGGMRK